MEHKIEAIFRSELQTKLEYILQLPAKKDRLGIYFEQFRRKQKITLAKDLDRTVFVRMYGREPEKSDALKIRYWRCGHHLPKNRDEMICLGQALDVSRKDLNTMLTEILLETGLYTEAYGKAPDFLTALSKRYLSLLPESRLDELQIKTNNTEKYLRHILFADLMDCIWCSEAEKNWYLKSHIYSRNFSSECARYFKKEEKISRSTITRLILIMLMPEINISIMNDALTYLGYAPLSFDICQKSGAHTDALFLWILEQMENCRSDNPEADRYLQKRMLRCVDEQIVTSIPKLSANDTEQGKIYKRQLQDLRIMKFRFFGKGEYIEKNG